MAQTINTTLAVFAIFSFATGHYVQPKIEQNLISTLLRTGHNLRSERSLHCFEEYLPQLNQATATYEAAYTKCLQNAANSKQRIENEVAEERRNATVSAEEICKSFSNCIDLSSSLDFFECANRAAGESISASYEIQNLSKAKSQYIRLRLDTISYDQSKCTDAASATYIEESSKLYAGLDACLAGTELRPDSTTRPSIVVTTGGGNRQ